MPRRTAPTPGSAPRRAPAAKRRRLGRGLGSLIAGPVEISAERDPRTDHAAPDRSSRAIAPPPDAIIADSTREGRVLALSLEAIIPNPRQPRSSFDDAGIDGLADSIRHAGVMQPIVVRPLAAGRFELVAGERRWRAARKIPLSTIPAIVRDVDDATAAEWALIENLQREDLNPVDRAEAFSTLINTFGLTQQELSERVGLERSTVSNILRLNELDAETKLEARSGALGLGHAKALLAITNIKTRRRFALKAISEGWSVRELERRVATVAGDGSTSTPHQRALAAAPSPQSAHLADLETKLGEHLGTRVHIRTGRRKGTGKIIIEFFSLDEFDGIMRRLGFEESV